MSTIVLRRMARADWPEVAALIYDSTNTWYRAHGHSPIFSGPKEDVSLFCSVYEQLDPGGCVVAEDTEAGRLAGSCFFHPRPTHFSLGIMNAHPEYFGQGIARRLLKYITDLADDEGKPMRLVSSALNLDSFSLYSTAGFVPRMIYQDMFLQVAETGLKHNTPGIERVREATFDDLPAMVGMEWEVNHINREEDWRHFIENKDGIWHVSVLDNQRGGIEGFLASVAHPAINMLGPGIMRTERQAAALISAELNWRRGLTLLWLVPSHCRELVQIMYSWGAKNCELHLAQSRGEWVAPNGIVLPTFMPETG